MCRTSMLQTSQGAGRAGDLASFELGKKIRGLQWTTRSACASVAGSEEISPRVASTGQSRRPSTSPAPGLALNHCPPFPALLPPPFRTAPPNPATPPAAFLVCMRLSQGSSQAAETPSLWTDPHSPSPLLPPLPRAPSPGHMGQVSALGVNTSRMGGWAWWSAGVSPARGCL